MQHYRLVDPSKLEGYARAFVVEDGDLDTVINIQVHTYLLAQHIQIKIYKHAIL